MSRPSRRRQGGRRRTSNDPAISRVVDLTIETLGSSGDGVGRFEGKPVFVPLTLPGDDLKVRLTERRGDGYAAELVEARLLEPRHQPICRHFGACGGCRLQHLPPIDYRAWKRQKVASALESRGIEDAFIRPLIDCDPQSRRRLRLAFDRAKGATTLGFRRRLGHDVVTIEECPIARPAIVSLFGPLGRCLATLDMAAKGGEALITSGDDGLDLLIETPIEPNLQDRERLAAFAEHADLGRLAWQHRDSPLPEPIAARRPVTVHFADVPAALPPGAFLQATAEAEVAIRKSVERMLQGSEIVGDLFAGLGAFALPLAAAGHRVHAIENQPAMVQALETAARQAGLGSSVRATIRDLDQAPLSPDEVAAFDALIIDPPRRGARAQIEAIAEANGPALIAMVSCNPSTFARDARLLIDAGYRLDWVQPIDAFLFSAEVELIGAFERGKTP